MKIVYDTVSLLLCSVINFKTYHYEKKESQIIKS